MLSDTAHLIKCIRNRLYSKKVFHINGKCVRWSCYDALYVADTKHAGDGRVCPKITYNHMNPSNTLQMRVKLFSKFRHLASLLPRGFSSTLSGVHPTCRMWSQQCSLLYSWTIPAEGVRLGGNDFQVIEDAIQWLDTWEEEVVSGKIHMDFFLTPSTAEGLRVT